MSEPQSLSDVPSSAPPVEPPAPTAPRPATSDGPTAAARPWPVLPVLAIVALVGALAALAFAWNGQQRLKFLEQELVRRQVDSASQAAQARLLADQSQALAREAVAKTTLMDTRIAELALQRNQLDDLVKSLSRSREENVLGEVDASLRAALQQTAITGSAVPLVTALKSADERLQRASEPRFEAIRRAIARDLERIQSARVSDLATLAIKIDEAARLVDELPLLVVDAASRPAAASTSTATAFATTNLTAASRPVSRAASAAATVSASASTPDASWFARAAPALADTLDHVWRQAGNELRSLVRVTRIDQPQAMLIAPDQSYFLRENLKLRLLNARLALLARQPETAQSDLRAALAAIEAYFDRNGRKTQSTLELLRGVADQARQAAVPRPEDTLSVLAAAAAGR